MTKEFGCRLRRRGTRMMSRRTKEQWKIKLQGFFIFFLFRMFFFGTDIWFVRAIGIAVTLATSVLLYAIGKELFDEITARFAMLFFGLSAAWLSLDGEFPAQTETFMIFFSVLAFFLLFHYAERPEKQKHRMTFVIGVSMAFAIAMKQVALFTAVAIIPFLFAYSFGKKTQWICTLAVYGAGIFFWHRAFHFAASFCGRRCF